MSFQNPIADYEKLQLHSVMYDSRSDVMTISRFRMNIARGEDQLIEARTCGDNNRSIAYKFMDGFHNLCIDKKDIIQAEIGACQMLLRACRDNESRKTVEKEIRNLKMAMNLMF